jgi:hypothetical protein
MRLLYVLPWLALGSAVVLVVTAAGYRGAATGAALKDLPTSFPTTLAIPACTPTPPSSFCGYEVATPAPNASTITGDLSLAHALNVAASVCFVAFLLTLGLMLWRRRRVTARLTPMQLQPHVVHERAMLLPIPPGWYADPTGQPVNRWWDGHQWTTNTAPRE